MRSTPTRLAPDLSFTVIGFGLVTLSGLVFEKLVPPVGGYVVDWLPDVPVQGDRSQRRTRIAPTKSEYALSAFISYGGRDEPFAGKLSEALNQNGIPTFFFPKDSVPGKKIHWTVRKGIAEHDRVILICSRNSLDREGVLFEIDEALTREAKMKGETLLIPIRLDRYVFDEWKPEKEDLAEAVRSRVVADFEGADIDEEKFQAGLRRLIAALRK